MKKLLLFILMIFSLLGNATSTKEIKFPVVYLEPLIFQDKEGNVTGFFYDIIEYIAKKEGIKTSYVLGNWEDVLSKVKNGDINLLLVSLTEERSTFLDFSKESALTVWTQVFTRPNSKISNILELDNKNIGIVKNDFNGQAFIELTKKFDINCKIVSFDDYEKIFKALNEGKLDAGVTMVTSSYSMEKKYDFEKTSIIFNPYNLYFAVPKNKNSDIIDIFDKNLAELKVDKSSYYYERLNYWIGIGEPSNQKFKKMGIYLVGFISLVALFFVGTSFVLKSKVKKATADLFEKNDELQIHIKNAENEKERAEEANKHLLLFKEVISNTSEGVVITDITGNILDANPSFLRLSDYTLDELMGQNPRLLKSGYHPKEFYDDMWKSIKSKGVWEGEVWNKKKDGSLYPKWLIINTVFNAEGNPSFYVGWNTDLSNQKDTEEKISHLFNYDHLTDLPNRTLLMETLAQSINYCNRSGCKIALLYIDIDNFKIINENYGHSFGDEIIKLTAQNIKNKIRSLDTLARFSGDEFLIIVNSYIDLEYLSFITEDIINATKTEYTINGIKVPCSVSVGISLYPEDDMLPENLLKKAESALYYAKAEGKGTYRYFYKELEEKLKLRVTLEKDLRQAIEKEQFSLYFQPQISLEKYINGEPSIIGCEALIRWRNSQGKIVPPNDFIPLAEETGMIVPIGKWVIEEGCRVAKEWSDRNRGMRVSVNVSSLQFEDPNFLEILDASLEKYKLSPIYFHLELTETTILNDVNIAQELLSQIRNRDIMYSLDDFGTGYSSLSYIKDLKASNLKIDKSFIFRINNSHQDKALIQVIISIAKLFGMTSIAEGVEDLDTLEQLYDIGCDEIQGYFISKPLPKKEFEKFCIEFNGTSLKDSFKKDKM